MYMVDIFPFPDSWQFAAFYNVVLNLCFRWINIYWKNHSTIHLCCMKYMGLENHLQKLFQGTWRSFAWSSDAALWLSMLKWWSPCQLSLEFRLQIISNFIFLIFKYLHIFWRTITLFSEVTFWRTTTSFWEVSHSH